MYDYIQEAIDNKECLLEWDEHQGAAPAPLLKDKFGGERRKAKVTSSISQHKWCSAVCT
jgi:DNA polymerase-1